VARLVYRNPDRVGADPIARKPNVACGNVGLEDATALRLKKAMSLAENSQWISKRIATWEYRWPLLRLNLRAA